MFYDLNFFFILELVTTAYTMLLLVTIHVKNIDLPPIKQIPSEIMDIMKILIKRHKIGNLIKLSKLCQIMWGKLSSNPELTRFDPALENHFVIIQVSGKIR